MTHGVGRLRAVVLGARRPALPDSPTILATGFRTEGRVGSRDPLVTATVVSRTIFSNFYFLIYL